MNREMLSLSGGNNLVVSLVMKENCAKTWKSLQVFCKRLSGNFPFTSLKMHGNSKSESVCNSHHSKKLP